MDTTPSRDPVPDTDPTTFFPDPAGFETPVFAAPEAEPLPPASASATSSTPAGRPNESRLRVLTAGAAVAGVAITAGIGLILAAGGGSSGTIANVTDPGASAPTTATTRSDDTTTTDGLADPGAAGQAPAFPGDGGRHGHGPRDAAGFLGSGTQTAPDSGTQTTPNAGIGAPSGATGPGHAATGGS